MKKTIVLLTLILLLLSCKSKFTRIGDENANYIPYYLKVYEADSLYIIKEYEKSYAILDKLFNEYEPIDMDTYFEFSSYFELKVVLNKKIKPKNFDLLVSKYGYVKERILVDSLLNIYVKNKYRDFEKKYPELRKTYLATINVSLRDSIIKMNALDQMYRQKEQDLSKLKEIDTVNIQKINKFFDKYGYINKKVIGNFSIDNSQVSIEVMLLHTQPDYRLKILMPKIHNYLLRGDASPLIYGKLYDQYLLYGGKEQYYGTYQNPKKIMMPLDTLNKRRKNIGLPSYGYERWRMKQLYPEKFN